MNRRTALGAAIALSFVLVLVGFQGGGNRRGGGGELVVEDDFEQSNCWLDEANGRPLAFDCDDSQPSGHVWRPLTPDAHVGGSDAPGWLTSSSTFGTAHYWFNGASRHVLDGETATQDQWVCLGKQTTATFSQSGPVFRATTFSNGGEGKVWFEIQYGWGGSSDQYRLAYCTGSGACTASVGASYRAADLSERWNEGDMICAELTGTDLAGDMAWSLWIFDGFSEPCPAREDFDTLGVLLVDKQAANPIGDAPVDSLLVGHGGNSDSNSIKLEHFCGGNAPI